MRVSELEVSDAVLVVEEVAQPYGIMEPRVDVDVLPEQLGEKVRPLP